MKKSILLFGAALLSLMASAQNPDIVRTDIGRNVNRAEFVLPQVNGYNLYKADLHMHTIYSDAECTPEYRVREAWCDGLDVIAITDHIEYRRHEAKFLSFLQGYVPEGTKAKNTDVIRKDADPSGIQADLNVPVKLAQKEAKKYGIVVIPGGEITREPVAIGHFNALFTTDNNKIYTADALQSLRNAHQQGALVMHNHPGWRRKSVDKTEFEVKAYGEGLIDGAEVANGAEFYPKIISRCMDEKLFVAANTDMHTTTAEQYRLKGLRRNMTLILAKDNSLKSLKEALEAKRTIAYTADMFIGEESLLKDLFLASVKAQVLSFDKKKGVNKVLISNPTSARFQFRRGNGNLHTLEPNGAIILDVKKGSKLTMAVESMWCYGDKHPLVELPVK